jgi:ribose 5-phosphate isomerase B
MKIAIATDHAGFELLRQLEAYLVIQGHSCVDYGPKELNPVDDYPDFIFPAAKAVANGECEVGIIMGGSGQGEAMAANRVKGVRCTVYYGAAEASAAVDVQGDLAKDQFEILRLSRRHNNANMLSLGARFLSLDDAKKAVEVWLGTSFSGEERHQRRNEKLDQMEG